MRDRPPTSATISDRSVSLVVLGTGHGSSAVYQGVCSAAYVLCVDKDPVLLIGAGYGVVQQCLRYFGRIPSDVFVSSNRSHVAAELPVLLAREANVRDCPIRLLGHPVVLQRVEMHRLAELHDVMQGRGEDVSALVDLCSVPPLDDVTATANASEEDYEHAQGVVLQDAPGISIRCFATSTSEFSAGVAIYCSHSGGARLFAVCGDNSEPKAAFLRYRLFLFHVVVLDGRRDRSTDHASFDDIFSLEVEATVPVPLEPPREAPLYRWFIGHYGGVEDAPQPIGYRSRIQPLLEGSVVHTRLLVAMRMHDEVGVKRFVNGEHHGNSVRVDEVRVGLVRDPSGGVTTNNNAPDSYVEDRDLALPPETKRAAPKVRPAAPSALSPTPTPKVRSSSPIVRRMQQPTMSSSRRNSSAPRTPTATRRSLSAQRNRSLAAAHERTSDDAIAPPPKRIYLFSNEDKGAPGRLLMAQTYRTVQQLKQRATEVLGLKPVADLHVMPSGEVASSVEQITNGACVVVTKIGGERFNAQRPPKALGGRHHVDASSISMASSNSPGKRASSPTRTAKDNQRGLNQSSSVPTAPAASPHVAEQFNEYMAQAAAILSSGHRQFSLIDLSANRTAPSQGEKGVVIAGALPVAARDAPAYLDTTASGSCVTEASDTDDIFGNRVDRLVDAPTSEAAPDRCEEVHRGVALAATGASSRRSSTTNSRRLVFTMAS
jgi:hypothetical protein